MPLQHRDIALQRTQWPPNAACQPLNIRTGHRPARQVYHRKKRLRRVFQLLEQRLQTARIAERGDNRVDGV